MCCVCSSRLQDSESEQTKMIVIPRYEPVFVEPNLKEYETQVLQMSVPVDEFDGAGAGGDRAGGRRGIDLDSISYITKDRFSPNTSATFRADETNITHVNDHYSTLAEGYDDTPIRNPLFGR